MSEKSQVKTETHPIWELRSLWTQDSHNVWLASTLSLNRNFAKFQFPAKLDKARQEQIVNLVFEALIDCPELKKPRLFRAGDVGPLEKEYLLEHFLAQDGFHQAHGGEGFIIDETAEFLGLINMHNHLQLQIFDVRQEIEKSWGRLIKIEDCIGKKVEYAFNSRFGFLNDVAAGSGTALTISLFLHIPAIIHMGELPDLLEREKEDEILAMGLQGNPKEMIGDILVAKNSCTLGLTEEYIITSLRMWATRAVVHEVSLRKRLREKGDEPLKNKIARAFGLLTHSYQLETLEALNALSLVKLGLDLGWVKASVPLNLNKIFFDCRRAHLMKHLGKSIKIPDLPRLRAEYLHGIVKDLSLVFS